MKEIFKLGKYIKPYKKHTIFGPIFKFIETILELLMPFILADVIDKGIMTGDRGYIFKKMWLLLLIVAIGLATATVCQYVASIASQGFGTELRHGLFKHISKLTHSELEGFGTSSLINRVTSDVNQLQVALAVAIRIIVRAPFICIGGFIMALFINWKLSLIILAAMPLFVLIIYFVMKMTVRLHSVVQEKVDKLLLVLHENLSGVRVIRAFARTKGEEKRFKKASDNQVDVATKVGKISSLLNPATQLIMNIAIVAILWFGGILTDKGEMSAGKMIALINYIGQILTALIVVAGLVITFTKSFASARRVNEVFDTNPTIKDGEISVAKTLNAKYAVEFKNVNFAYEEGDDELSLINASIPRGSIVGMIGGTGSGKSTLVNLILRFYDVKQGEVLVFDENVKDYKVDTLRDLVGLVPQKIELFSGTIESNIKWGNKEATNKDVKEAAGIAQASDFIESLPKAYESKVERGGTNFSGGQKQRIAIARALVRSPEILILDDASSALDYATDRALRQAIRRNSKEQTLFMVSQRVSAIKDADIILVIDDGKLVGTGKHNHLLDISSVYMDICKSQNIGKDGGEV